MKNPICRTASLGLMIALVCALPLVAQRRMGLPGPGPAGGPPGVGMSPDMDNPGRKPPSGGVQPGSRGAQAQANTANGSARAGVQFGPVGRWWDDKSVVRAVGISSDQQQRMDQIFNASKPGILATYKTYLAEQSKLNALTRNPQASQASTFAAIDAVNLARANLQKATAQMYMQIRQQMNTTQVEKLEKLQ